MPQQAQLSHSSSLIHTPDSLVFLEARREKKSMGECGRGLPQGVLNEPEALSARREKVKVGWGG